MLRPLKIYKASAGSGKTFTLAVEYIKLLIINPFEYRHILAVTFTNKATAEMKTRIIGQLNGIAKGLGSSQGYFNRIKECEEIQALGLTDEEIRERAAVALSSMIHNYSRFRIETIDSFFQSIIRELAHELDLTANLRVDLNDSEVLAEAVKGIIDRLEEKTEVFKSIIGFIEEKIEDDKNWKIDDEIEKFGRNIFNEHFLQKGAAVRQKISDRSFLVEYKRKLNAMRTSLEEEAKACGAAFMEACAREGLKVSDFKGGGGNAGIYPFFEKLAEGKSPNISASVKKRIGNADEWGKNNEQVRALAETLFIGLLDKVVAGRTLCTTVEVVLKHINHVMLLNVINSKVRELNMEANRFLLADTAHFLRDLIDGSDIPFIYEKTGTRFNHIMIDEFQDTSGLQWENFKPLLANSLSSANECLIVGDVKQSIYRFRNSDWSILNNIGDGVFGRQSEEILLSTNYRSSEEVITFNNAFFSSAVKILNEDYRTMCGEDSSDLLRAYSDVQQKVSDRKIGQGYVRVECIDGCGSDAINGNSLSAAGYASADTADSKEAGCCEISYVDATLARLADTVDELKRRGVSENDMTILIRFNKQIPAISEYFAAHKPEVRIVSDEAFRLDSSPALLLIVLALKLIANPADNFVRSTLAYKFQTVVMGNVCGIDESFLGDREQIDCLLPEEFCMKEEYLSVMPLYELSEELYKMFSLDRIKNQDAYLFCFYDCLTAYLKDNPSDIDSFIAYWEETLREKTIPNGAADGIRIMSIHKSKGLEFHTVLVPFCDWELVSKGRSGGPSLMWCEPDREPFNELPLAPIDFTEKAYDSIFRKDYEEEVLRNYVDNLNLIYVAFTRAENNLFIFTGKNPEKKKEDGVTGNLYRLVCKALPDNFSETEIPGLLVRHERGTLVESRQKQSEEDENVVNRAYSQISSRFEYFDTLAEFRQSNKSAQFINDEEENSREQEYIDEGLLFHRLFAMIETPDDIDKVVRELDGEGCFASVKYRDDVTRLVRKAFSNTRAATWFSPKWQTFNECSIIFKDEKGNVKERRPDRVVMSEDETIVIDYKTGKQSVEHEEQVREYMHLLKQMGYMNVKGYIWYIRRNDIVSVTGD